MPIIDAIQRIDSQHQLFFLLTGYIKGLRFCDGQDFLPWEQRNLPLAGVDDVKTRITCLSLRLRGMASDANHSHRLNIEEAMEVFRTALRRLANLQGDAGLPQVA